MSDIVSSDNLVNALNSVRDDYHEHLKSIPQYEAFLLIESSTHRVFETLHGLVNSPAPAMAAEVISSLEIAKTKFKEHLTSVPEYRALLAIEKLINDVSIDLGVAQPAPAPVILATVEHEIPPEPASIQPEPDLADSDPADFTSEQAVSQPAAAEIASIEQLAAPQAEPDLAASASEHTLMQPEAQVIASAQQIVATQPAEPDVAVPAFEHTLALAAEIASNHLMSATQLDPDLAVSASEHATTRVRLSEIAFAGPVITAQNEYLSEPVLAKERAATGEPAWNTAAVAVEELYDFDEPPAAPREDGSERAA